MSTTDQQTGVAGRLRVVPFGPAALAELASTVAGAKAGDPLAPVTVVVPSAHAGVTLRRRLAAGGGVINGQLLSFPQLLGALATPVLAHDRRPPLTAVVELAAVRAVLRDEPGWLGQVGPGGTTAQSVAATLGEVGDLPEVRLDELASLSRRGAEVVRLLRAVRRRCASHAGPPDVVAAAVEAVARDAGWRARFGEVVVHLPRQLGHGEVALIRALAEQDAVTVLIGSAEPYGGDDPVVTRLVDRLQPSLGPATDRRPVAPAGGTAEPMAPGEAGAPNHVAPGRRQVVRAPDPDEEVRHATRQVLAAIDRGVRPDRIAVIVRLADPYLALVHEQFVAVGIPHHGPTGLRLEQTVAGRTLLGGLDVLGDDLPRSDLLRWLRAAPLRQPDGAALPVDSFERIAREIGVAGGREQWSERLAVASEEIRRRLADLDDADGAPAADGPAADGPAVDGPAADGPAVDADAGGGAAGEPVPPTGTGSGRAAQFRRRAAHLATLREVVAWLAAMADEAAGLTGWRPRADWGRRFLTALLGPAEQFRPPVVVEGPLPDGEARAYQRVLDVLDGVAALDELGEPCDALTFREVLQAELEDPARPAGVFGRGVFVGGVAEAVGAHHDLLIVLGMAEGVYPPRGQDDPILPDRLRAELGPDVLAPRRTPQADERRDHEAAVAGAADVVFSFARADTRAQRERLPSRWLLEEVHRLLGPGADRPGADVLDALSPSTGARASGTAAVAPAWYTDIASFASVVEATSSVDDHPVLVDRAEAAAAEIFRHRQLSADPQVVVAPSDRVALMRGLAAGIDRHAGRFGEFTGRVGPHPALVFDDDRVGSATSFEHWATCPFRYFVRYVLDVHGPDERADTDDINPLDRGSYIHKVLEEYVGHDLVDSVGVARRGFSSDELDRLRQVAGEVGEQFRADGRTGRPLLWSLRSEQLLRRLERILHDDAAHRRTRGVQPVAVELAFGMGRHDERSGPAPHEEGADGEAVPPVPPVVVRLDGDRPLAFRGYIDRVDRSPDGDRLVVIDYKTGKSTGYEDIRGRRGTAPDIVSRGRHLQLALYALAARSRFGDVPVSAFFWFVEQEKNAFVGGDIDDAALRRLHEVLRTMVDGIEAGQFPARPGDDGFFGFDNCGYCDFDRICPPSRGDLWERVRLDPAIRAYKHLAEDPLDPPASDEVAR